MIFLLILEILILFLATGMIILYLLEFWAIFTTVAPFVPIPKHVEDAIIQHLRLLENSVLYDLGCGDGRVLVRATEQIPTVTAIGIERAWRPYLLAKRKTRNTPVQIRRADFFKTPLQDATHIFVYLFPEALEQLFPVLYERCAPGTRIVSCDFQAQKYSPTEIIEVDENAPRGKRLYIYTL